MPTKARREDAFIQRFLSGYEDGAWANSSIEWLDKTRDAAVEARATRGADGATVAIEHTIIEPFVSDKEDFAYFETAFLTIEDDKSLLVPGKWIRAFVPVGILRKQFTRTGRDAIVKAVHTWLRRNTPSVRNGDSEHHWTITVPETGALEMSLTVKVVPLAGGGKLHIRRQQMENTLGKVVEKALTRKLPKLAKTEADKRILLLERQHMNLFPKDILNEIDTRRGQFADLAAVHEIWILETMFYESDSYLRFERYENDVLVDNLDFQGTDLLEL